MPSPIVIFDLDGTLLDTLEDLAAAGNHVLEHFNYPVHTVDEYRYFVGDGLQTLIDRIVPASVNQEDRDNCLQLFRTFYGEHWHDRTEIYAGVETLLSTLKKAGRRLAILSNKPHDFTMMCAAHFFDKNLFELVLGQRPEVAKKPHPAGALEIARRTGAVPGSCIYVGDTKVDMTTGKAAGMFTIGVLWGFREAAELRENGADMLVKTPDDLTKAILTL